MDAISSQIGRVDTGNVSPSRFHRSALLGSAGSVSPRVLSRTCSSNHTGEA